MRRPNPTRATRESCSRRTAAIFTVVLDARQSVSAGTEVELAVDHRRLHFFDPETGLALDGAGRSTVAA